MASPSPRHARFGSGQSVRRVEDEALLKGQGRFADDVNAPGQLHAAFLRSPHAHARIVAIDTRAAAAMSGVVAVYTGQDLTRAGVKPLALSADFRRADGSPTATPPWHALAVDAARFVGEAVAAVIAESVRANTSKPLVSLSSRCTTPRVPSSRLLPRFFRSRLSSARTI